MATFQSRITKTILIFLGITFLSSCFKEDEPMPPYVSPEGVVSNQVKLGKYYTKFAYYSLKNNQFLNIAECTSWDLGFSCQPDRYELLVNTHKSMRVGHTSKAYAEINQIQDVDFWSYEKSGDAFHDSTALGKWWKETGVSLDSAYVLDLGKDLSTGNSLGYKKIKISSFENGKYHVSVANLNGTEERNIEIAKNTQYNFVHYSLTTNEQVLVEPMKTEWDLFFGQYMTVLYDGSAPMDYSVNGVWINALNGVRVAVEKEKSMDEIKVGDLGNYTFYAVQDVIGHTWKKVGGIDGPINYSVFPWVFLIKSVEGDYYKLRFTSFSDELGEKGSPALEVGKF